MNLQEMADIAASMLTENLNVGAIKPLDFDSPKRATYERIWISFKPDGWYSDADLESCFLLPAAVALAREADKLGRVQFACPDESETYQRAGRYGNTLLVASVTDGAVTLSTLIGKIE